MAKPSKSTSKPSSEPMTSSSQAEEPPSTVENVISIVLGLAVVLVIGAMIVNTIRNRQNPPPPTPTAEEQAKLATVSATHTVVAGETLWSIAEKYYNDGYKWPEIQKANNMPTADAIEKDMKLIIPKIEGAVAGTTDVSPTAAPTAVAPTAVTATAAPTAVPTATAAPSKDTGSTGPTGGTAPGEAISTSTDREYKVATGDTLWAIAVKRYNNGYRWVDIAKANKLVNPDVIHPGNVFTLPE